MRSCMAGIIIAAVALVVSTLALWYSRQSDERDVLLQLFDRMSESEAQYGRRLLYEQAALCAVVGFPRPGQPRQHRPLHGDVRPARLLRGARHSAREAIHDMWAGTIAHVWLAGKPYIDHRRVNEPPF